MIVTPGRCARGGRAEASTRRRRASTRGEPRDHPARRRARHPAGARGVPAHQQLGPPHRGALAHGLARQRPRLRRRPPPRDARGGGLRASGETGCVSSAAASAGSSPAGPFADPDARLLLYLALASVPGALAGLLLDDWAETAFRSPGLVALMMALMGVVLWIADRRAGRAGEGEVVSLRDALLIGLAQALAIVPGTSRSGATISMALFLGHRRGGGGPVQLPPRPADHLRRRPREGARPRPGGCFPRPGGRGNAGRGGLGLPRHPRPARVREDAHLHALRRVPVRLRAPRLGRPLGAARATGIKSLA